VLGVNGNVIIGHGISNETAIKNMILLSQEVVKADLPQKIQHAFN
jgi:glycerol-3-phosphate acyltransferase PlsX